MLRWAAAALILLALAPGSAAFSSAQEPLSIAYEIAATPTMIAAGALFLDGEVGTGVVIAGASGTSFERVPELRVMDRSAPLTVETPYRDATLVLEQGALLWSFPNDATAELATSERYAVAVALPQAPIPSGSGAMPAGFLLASEEITGTIGWARGEAALVPFDAVVTILDARGQPVPGWHSKRVNAGATTQEDPATMQYGFAATGGFTARLSATVLGGAAAGPSGELRLVIGPADEDRYQETADTLAAATNALFGPASPLAGEGDPLDAFGSVSGVLNGALVILPGAAGGAGPAPVLLASSLGGEEFPLGAFNLVRGEDLQLSWSATRMHLSGTPTVALGRDGFGVDEPARVGVFPIVSLLLWAIAVGAVVFSFVRRPAKEAGPMAWRLASFGAFVLMLLVALVLWDRSFEQTFGTGVMSTVRDEGISMEALPRIGILAALELVPWSIAGLLFALPVRIAAGIGLRYLGRGKSFNGLAGVAGLLALATLGPVYALWCFNLAWARLASALPSS